MMIKFLKFSKSRGCSKMIDFDGKEFGEREINQLKR